MKNRFKINKLFLSITLKKLFIYFFYIKIK